MKTKFIAYLRVSTKSQGLDGYGIAAQSDSIQNYIARTDSELIAQFSETESGSKDDRPQLMAALALAKKEKAILLVARLDRLSRDLFFIISLQKNEVAFRSVDFPEADTFTLNLFAILAQKEREMIATRTKLALQAAKKRGVQLGNPNVERQVKILVASKKKKTDEFKAKMLPIIADIRKTGCSTLQGIADCLNRRGIKTFTNKSVWFPGTVRCYV